MTAWNIVDAGEEGALDPAQIEHGDCVQPLPKDVIRHGEGGVPCGVLAPEPSDNPIVHQRFIAPVERVPKADMNRRRILAHIVCSADDTIPRQGACLVGTHLGGALVPALALSRLRLPIFVIVRSPPGSLPLSDSFEICDLRKESAHRAMMTARAKLRRGQIVFLAGDVPSAS